MVPVLGWSATTLEFALGVGLAIGYRLRLIALLTAALTALFAVAMSFTLGVHEPLNYSVFTFAASSYLLAAISNHRSNQRDETANRLPN